LGGKCRGPGNVFLPGRSEKPGAPLSVPHRPFSPLHLLARRGPPPLPAVRIRARAFFRVAPATWGSVPPRFSVSPVPPRPAAGENVGPVPTIRPRPAFGGGSPCRPPKRGGRRFGPASTPPAPGGGHCPFRGAPASTGAKLFFGLRSPGTTALSRVWAWALSGSNVPGRPSRPPWVPLFDPFITGGPGRIPRWGRPGRYPPARRCCPSDIAGSPPLPRGPPLRPVPPPPPPPPGFFFRGRGSAELEAPFPAALPLRFVRGAPL